MRACGERSRRQAGSQGRPPAVIRALWALLVVIVAIPAPAAAVQGWPLPLGRLPMSPPPAVSAPAWILYDDTFGVTLSSAHADERLPMASTTKIMTALLALEAPPGDVVVSPAAANTGEAEIGLLAGERFPIADLVTVLLVRSANDAAVAVAEAVGGSVEGFVSRMNERAGELGLENTHFTNPHGLDDPDHYSSPADLLTLAGVAMKNPRFAQAVRTTSAEIRPAPDGTRRVARTTNHLLTEYEGAIGVKTGFTAGASLVLVAAAEREGRRLFAVVMGSEGERGHFRDAAALLDYGFVQGRIVPAAIVGPSWTTGAYDRAVDAEASTRAALVLASIGLGPSAGSAVLVPPRTDALADLPDVDDAVRWWWR